MSGLNKIKQCIEMSVIVTDFKSFLENLNQFFHTKKFFLNNLIKDFYSQPFIQIGYGINHIKIFTLPNDYFILLNKIGEGSYGVIYNVINNRKKYVIRIVKKDICEMDNIEPSEIMEEYLKHIFLYCLHDQMKKQIGINFLQPFPKIEKIFIAPYLPTPILKKNIEQFTQDNKLIQCIEKINIKEEKEIEVEKEGNFVCVMESLDMCFFDYMERKLHNNDVNKVFSILIQICYQLNCLQKSIEFIHGDFHTANIMLRKKKFNLTIDNYQYKQEYQVFFIDFDRCSIDLSVCKECDIISTKFKSNDKNKSTDLRILLHTFYLKYNVLPDKNFNDYLHKICKKYIIPNYYKNEPLHYFYQLNSDDTNFHPLQVIIELQKLIK